MIPLLTPNLVRQIDAIYVERGIDPCELMEGAAQNVAAAIKPRIPQHSVVLVACGNGNNGGDGYCVARMLAESRSDVTVAVVNNGQQDGRTVCTQLNANRLTEAVNVYTFDDGALQSLRPTVVIDALLGVGSTVELRDDVVQYLRTLNALQADIRIAIDVPTGMDALTGECHEDVFRATHTVTIGASKVGFLQRTNVTGEVIVVPLRSADDPMPLADAYMCYENADLSALPVRSVRGSKFSHGRVVVIGGTEHMPGAPSLAATAALSVGAGIVDMVAPVIHPLTPREIMVWATEDVASLDALLERATVIAVGPGLGGDATRLANLAHALRPYIGVKPVVIDADGLRLLALLNEPLHNVVCTPHLGEFARMVPDLDTTDLSAVWDAAQRYAQSCGCVVHVKSVPALTTNGVNNIVVPNGDPILGTAGSGDVLTGIIAGLAAQGLPLFNAASLGALIHAQAGQDLATQYRSILAGELIESVRHIMAHHRAHSSS